VQWLEQQPVRQESRNEAAADVSTRTCWRKRISYDSKGDGKKVKGEEKEGAGGGGGGKEGTYYVPCAGRKKGLSLVFKRAFRSGGIGMVIQGGG